MLITVKSFIPYLTNLNGTHEINSSQTIKCFLESLGVKWDEDALVILNKTISNGTEFIHDQDRIELLIPISGG